MVDNREVHIYALRHPDTLEIRYVGKTVRKLSRRLGNHIANAKGNQHNKHLSNWILNILKENKKPVMELLETCQSNNWQEREQYWISQFPNLINLTAGGDGCVGFIHDSKAIEKIRQSKIGTKHSVEFKEAMSKRLKGVPLSEEHKSKIGLANKGRKASETARKRLSESHKGITQSEESKRKRSESIKLWWTKRKSIEDIVKS